MNKIKVKYSWNGYAVFIIPSNYTLRDTLDYIFNYGYDKNHNKYREFEIIRMIPINNFEIEISVLYGKFIEDWKVAWVI